MTECFRWIAIAEARGDTSCEKIGLVEVIGGIIEKLVQVSHCLGSDDLIIVGGVGLCEDCVSKATLRTPMIVKFVQCEVLTTFIGTRYRCDFRARRVLSGSLDYELLRDLRIADPYVHLTICCQTEDLVVLFTEHVH